MRENYYEARRRGKVKYARAVSQGRSGYLPSLEGILEHTSLAGEKAVGVEHVPMDKIAGTVNRGRARSFAPDFLPLPKHPSEFSTKWIYVYAHQMDTGIVDPIEVREYLNWYWVVEGNKRVSVLKYLEASQIEARVTRLFPQRDDTDTAVATYYRFLPFKEETGISSIWIREPDGYNRLLSHLRNRYGQDADKEVYRHFYSSVYLPFREIYKTHGGDKLPYTTGEAFLRFVEMAGFPEKATENDIKQSVQRVIKELEVKEEDVGITTGSLKQAEPTLVGTLGQLMRPVKPLKVAFVYYGSSAVAVWTRGHEKAQRDVEERMRGRVETRAFQTSEEISSFSEVIRKAADFADVVFSTAAILYEETRKIAIRYPNVRFYVASREKSGVYVRTYSPRTHEVHYLVGMIAGAMCKKRNIRFVVSNYSAYGFAAINAFTLGARGVNRYTRVKLSWHDHWEHDNKNSTSIPVDIHTGDEVFFHNVLPPIQNKEPQYGLYSYRDGMFHRYAELSYDWSEFYRGVLENILVGGTKDFESVSGKQAKFLTYWGGLRNGIIELSIDENQVPHEIRRVVEGVKRLMLIDEFSPFTGPIEDRFGILRVAENEKLDYDGITSMDYLVRGVDGPYVDPKKVVTS